MGVLWRDPFMVWLSLPWKWNLSLKIYRGFLDYVVEWSNYQASLMNLTPSISKANLCSFKNAGILFSWSNVFQNCQTIDGSIWMMSSNKIRWYSSVCMGLKGTLKLVTFGLLQKEKCVFESKTNRKVHARCMGFLVVKLSGVRIAPTMYWVMQTSDQPLWIWAPFAHFVHSYRKAQSY